MATSTATRVPICTRVMPAGPPRQELASLARRRIRSPLAAIATRAAPPPIPRMISCLTVVADPGFFRDLSYVFVAAVLGALLARTARQPLILGYVAGGLLISPLTPGPAVSDLHTFELFAEIGVVLLMFSIGVEFSLRDLLRVKWIAIVGGPLGIVLSVGLGI